MITGAPRARVRSVNWHAAVLNALPQDIDPRAVELLSNRPQMLRNVLRQALCTPAARLETRWKIKLGQQTEAVTFLHMLDSSGCRVTNLAANMILCDQFPTVHERTVAELAVLSVSALGFERGARYGQICAKGQAAGLQLCPAEVGPALRVAYLNQSQGERLRLAMDGIAASRDHSTIFKVERSGDTLWLNWDVGDRNHFCRPDLEFVFVVSRT